MMIPTTAPSGAGADRVRLVGHGGLRLGLQRRAHLAAPRAAERVSLSCCLAGKKKAAAAADLPAVVPVTFDAAAAFGPAAAAAAAPAAAAAAADPGAAAAAPPAMVVPGAAGAAPTVLSTEQLQLMLQQQALIAAMAAQAGGPIQGLQLAPPPGVSLEQAQLMGLPIMAMPVVAGAMPAAAALPPPAAAKPVARGGGGTSGDDEYTASGRRKRKDTGAGSAVQCSAGVGRRCSCPEASGEKAALLTHHSPLTHPPRPCCRQDAAAVAQLDR